MERVRELNEDVRDIVSSIVLFPGVFGVIDDLISFPVLFVCHRINYIFFVMTYIEIFYP